MEDMLATLQAPPLGQIADVKTLQNVVLGLEELPGKRTTCRVNRPEPRLRMSVGALG
jgi:hypothetical protein